MFDCFCCIHSLNSELLREHSLDDQNSSAYLEVDKAPMLLFLYSSHVLRMLIISHIALKDPFCLLSTSCNIG